MAKNKFSVSDLPDDLPHTNLVLQQANEVEQLKLFTESHFEGSKTNTLSNTFPLYDLWSRFVRLKKVKYKISEAPERLINSRVISDSFEGFQYKGELDIVPAIIKGKDSDIVAWPSDREEKVERALVRLAAKGHITQINNGSGTRYAIHFYLAELNNELKSVNQSLSQPDLKEALLILAGSRLSFNYKTMKDDGDDESYEANIPYLGSIHFSNKKGKSQQRCVVFLNEYMAQQIETVTYKGYYFNQAQQFKRTLSSWLTTRLYTVFRYAAPNRTYSIRLTHAMIKFGSIESEDIPSSRLVAIRRNMTETMKDLIEAGILIKYEVESKKDDNGNIVDYVYSLFPTPSFCDEIIALNKHDKKIKIKHANYKQIENLTNS